MLYELVILYVLNTIGGPKTLKGENQVRPKNACKSLLSSGGWISVHTHL